jgi:hypothetical protein
LSQLDCWDAHLTPLARVWYVPRFNLFFAVSVEALLGVEV